LNFRQHLKQIIRVFIETIFLKLLDSSNSSYQHKNLILGVFDKISKNTQMLLEIFVNYDCDILQKDLTERIIESLCKIANGRFAKTEHKDLISPQEAIQLRNYATSILVQILRSFNGTIDAKIAESKIS
jgi:Sec7-like guanine-nucleotide exchange factor